MGVLDQEIGLVQNQAYGAALLAGFVVGFQAKHPEKSGPPLPYLFVALPMLLNAEILELLGSNRLGLRGFAEKCVSVEKAGTDLLLSINRRAIQYRELTSRSIEVLLSSRLCHLDARTGTLLPLPGTALESNPVLPMSYHMASKLGEWFSELTAFEIGSILKVTF
ncbi:MAG TPA: three component ABC system middle component [Bryobacteraceae bacterium]|jgi:hypothetical protein